MIGFLEQRFLSIYKKYRKTIIVLPVVVGCLFYLTTAFAPIINKKEQVNKKPEKESEWVAPVPSSKKTEKEAVPPPSKDIKSDSSRSRSKSAVSRKNVIKEEIIEDTMDTDIVVYTPSEEAIEKMTRPMRSARVKVSGRQTLSSKRPYLRLVLLEPFQLGTLRLPKGSDVFAKATFEDEGVRLSVHQIEVEQKRYDTNMIVLGPEGYAVFPTQGKAKLRFTNEAMTLRLKN